MGCVCTVFEFLFRLFAIPCLQTGNLWLQVLDLEERAKGFYINPSSAKLKCAVLVMIR